MEEIRLIQGREELSQALSLCRRVFDGFLAPISAPEGREFFHGVTDTGRNLAGMERGEYAFAGAYDGDSLTGVIATRNKGGHIMFLFVEEGYHRRGIAARLVEWAMARCPGPVLTVNASDYAIPAYERMGFRVTGERTDEDGVGFTPMESACGEQSVAE